MEFVMKVVILNQHFYPEIAATSQLLTDLAEDLAQQGFHATVITGMPSYFHEEKTKCRAYGRDCS